MPHVPGLCVMVNLEYGYAVSMDIFVTRTRNYIRSLIEEEDLEISSSTQDVIQNGIRNCVRNFLKEEFPGNVSQNVDAYSIKEMVMVGDTLIRNRWNGFGADFTNRYMAHVVGTMKGMVKLHTEHEMSDLNDSICAMMKFEWDLDEDNSISWYKLSQYLNSYIKIEKPLFTVVFYMAGETRPNSRKCLDV
jgi:hypothetical protein